MKQLYALLLIFISISSSAQISGVVMDENDKTLDLVTVSIVNALDSSSVS